MVQSKGTLKIQPTTLTDLTVTRSQYDQVINTLSLSDFTVQNDYLESNINFIARDKATISSTGYQTQTITVDPSTFKNAIVLVPLEFSNIETNSIKYYCKDEVARNSITSITTDLSNKAETDLANVTDAGKVLMSGMGMPSNKALTFTVGASGSNITIPANGWLAFRGKASVANQFVSLKISGGSVYREEERQVPYVNGWVTILIPVNAGDTITYYYNIKASDIYQFQLIYAQGSKN